MAEATAKPNQGKGGGCNNTNLMDRLINQRNIKALRGKGIDEAMTMFGQMIESAAKKVETAGLNVGEYAKTRGDILQDSMIKKFQGVASAKQDLANQFRGAAKVDYRDIVSALIKAPESAGPEVLKAQLANSGLAKMSADIATKVKPVSIKPPKRSANFADETVYKPAAKTMSKDVIAERIRLRKKAPEGSKKTGTIKKGAGAGGAPPAGAKPEGKAPAPAKVPEKEKGKGKKGK